MNQTGNFSFLAEHSPLLAQLGAAAEQTFASDPNTTLIKLRQFGEAMAQDLASRFGVEFDQTTKQADLLFQLDREAGLDKAIRGLFHTLRVEGNKATHEFKTQHKEAMDGLKIARALAIWFETSFGKQGTAFKPGPFVPPEDPSTHLRYLQIEIDQLKAQLKSASQSLESSQHLADLVAQEKETYETLALQMDVEAKTYKELAFEQEAALKNVQQAFDAQLKALQDQLDAKQVTQAKVSTQKATKQLVLSEDLTRILIDQQLMEAGWDADTVELTYAKGVRPELGKNKAIAEWPTHDGPADYVLFAGMMPIAIVEAKKQSKGVADTIQQAERYSRGLKLAPDHIAPWQVEGQAGPWPDGQTGSFKVPFVYSCNSRPYIKQLAEQSGTWFRDVRAPSNLSSPLAGFHQPAGLLDRLKRSKEDAEAKLEVEGFGYLKLRDYQVKAIQAVETALADGQREALVAMATGTGKTRTIIGLMYRLLKAERFRRILFLVDRTALGQQATDTFEEALLEQNQPLSKIYNVAKLGDMSAEAETRVQIATVQAMVRRVFQSDTPPGIDEFDCIIVDEAHRGYTLDQEMTEGELVMRDQGQYLSSYRRVLDYFDAVKVALTATPAKHTTEIFGKPVYTYSYREAVADDWLIDHEPPIRYETLLSKNGIHFQKGETVTAINTSTGEIELSELDDEVDFSVEAFNKSVINEQFNKVICDQLAKELDPFGDEKTLIFCATDLHAEMVKRLLNEAFRDVWGDSYNEAAVKKITGASDKVEQLIRLYKNEKFPNIAITVDLLTTGIDVPTISHLVFLRRVRSRILFEQMIGRATRRCDEIGKTVFRIYDPVDIYAALQDVTTMKPLVKDPNVTMEQLIEELADPASLAAPGSGPDRTHAHDVLDALSQGLMRVLRKATYAAGKRPALGERLAQLEQTWGVPPSKLHKHLHSLGPICAADFVREHKQLLEQLAEVKQLVGTGHMQIISEHADELVSREQSYGEYGRPEDYLDSFSHFIHEQINQSAALAVVVNRPKDLTRADLKEVRLLLDQHGFNEARIKTAWRNQTNQDIAASIVGYIRQAALGEALVPFDQRVARAMEGIYKLTKWTQVQRNWLGRLAKQLAHEVVLDQQFVNSTFANDGGAKQLDKMLGGKLDAVLHDLAEALWPQVA
ncbi:MULTISPECIES: type I restriction-modification system endonuclease [Paraburkholderia]|uniref:type I restriction-modification system endonuclease n=1 Tax=Paraburkholderia TaxID=1822464 RepID=UPI00035EEAA3|nr:MULTISPECIES: type I restriction-modification system endonuclease [Paraburkholderia]MDH6150495.1 type I restriction enzyme R subunit [Paraburkholderia sp. WSM4179]